MLKRRRGFELLMTAVVCVVSVQAPGFADDVTGFVYEDLDADGIRDPAEPGVMQVTVSNGRDVVRTGLDGSYELPVADGDVIFVTKPRGFRVSTDANHLPLFYYHHAPEGTPKHLELRYSGVEPTGPLPESVDFPLIRAEEPDRFQVILFSDPQPQTTVEVGYIRDDVIDGLVGTDAAFGMTLGDVMYDDLSLYPRYNRIVSRVGIPWYNVPGNHDMNYLVPDDLHALETFKRTFGPTYYSFDYGQAHFVVLDDVLYEGTDTGVEQPHPRGQGSYIGRISDEQMTWLSRDLSFVPQDRLVVLAMHIPFRSFNTADRPQHHVANRDELFALLEGRERVFAIAGHMHTAEHHYFGKAEGFHGPQPLHQHVIGAVSGSWWSGPFDERGIPTSWQRDGTPNGYYVMTVDGLRCELRFQAAREPGSFQMRIMLDSSFHRYKASAMRDFRMGELLGSPIDRDQIQATEVLVNLFDGGPRSKVVLRIDDRLPVGMQRVRRPDPFIEELFARHAETIKPWVGVDSSSHLWTARLPAGLESGVHTITVRAEDEYGQVHTAHKVFEIVGSAARPTPPRSASVESF